MAAEPTITNICTSWVFQGAAGGAVGVGIMILLLAKWGKKIFGGDALLAGPQGAQGIPGVPGTLSPCPFAGDHRHAEPGDPGRGHLPELYHGERRGHGGGGL